MSRGLAVALALAGLAGAPARGDDAPATAAPAAKADEALRTALASLVRRVAPSIVPVQVRGPDGSVTRRQAVVVDASGWLVMAGPTPGAQDSLVGLMARETAARLIPVASDPETALTLLQLLAPPTTLHPLTLPEVEGRRPLPAPPVPGAPLTMVVADGAVARGGLRATDRRRRVLDGAHGVQLTVTGLLEASLATVASDMGAPWFDADGRLAGLLVGGLVEESPPDPADGSGLALRPEPVAAHAVPAAVVALVWPLLRTEGEVRRARLGLRTEVLSPALQAQMCPSCGAYAVTGVEPEGPGARGGIEVHDLIVALEGLPLRPEVSLGDLLLPFRPLDPVKVTVLRRGQRVDLPVVLGRR